MVVGLSGGFGQILAAATPVVVRPFLVSSWIVGRSARLAVLSSLAVVPAFSSAIIVAVKILAHTLAPPQLSWEWAVIVGLTAVIALMIRLIIGVLSERTQ